MSTYEAIYVALDRHFNQTRCLDAVNGIWQNDRLQSFDAFNQTAEFCEAALRDAGLSEVERLKLRADGRTPHGDFVIPKAWDVRGATLKVVDGPILADYVHTPTCLFMLSAPTPPVSVRVVHIDAQDIRGAMVFTSEQPKTVLSRAISGGAIGIITDFMPLYPGVRDSREAVYDVTRWENALTMDLTQSGLFGFSLSPGKGDLLRTLMNNGEVILSATVDVAVYDGHADTISGLLPGQNDREIMAFGHLYEPGAHDNASGCGALIEAARALTAAIDAGDLPRPMRSIRFAMGWECAGSMGYFAAHPERIKRTESGLVLDMVGTADIDNARLSVWHNPMSRTGTIDAIVPAVLRECMAYADECYAFDERPYNFGTDNILCDLFPTVALIAEPALSYHSSMDTIKRIEPHVLRRNALAAAVMLHTLANADLSRTQLQMNIASYTGKDIVPIRKMTYGPVTFDPLLARGQDKLPFNAAWNTGLHQSLMWVDGTRTIWEIAHFTAHEWGTVDIEMVYTQLKATFEALERLGYISFI